MGYVENRVEMGQEGHANDARDAGGGIDRSEACEVETRVARASHEVGAAWEGQSDVLEGKHDGRVRRRRQSERDSKI